MSFQTRYLLSSDSTLNNTTRKALGFQIEDMLFSCEYNAKPCNSSDFTYIFNNLYGNCYTWNKATPPLQTSLAERDGGLAFELYLGNPIQDTVYNYEDGVYISIHNQSDYPFSKNPVIIAAAGASSYFSLKKNILQKLQPPYGTCIADGFSSDLHDYIVNSGAVYSREYCFNLCFGELFTSTCGCKQINYPTINSSFPVCSLFIPSQVACARSIYISILNASTVSLCTDKCPYECNQTQYDIKTFQARYPVESWVPYLYNKTISKGFSVNYTDISKAYALIGISYESMIYRSLIETAKYGVMDLLGMIGGIL
jgi:hypothetical protein